MGKHRYIYLKEAERLLLMRLIHQSELTVRVQTRARILLLSDRNHKGICTIAEVAKRASCSIGTVRNVKRNYFAGASKLPSMSKRDQASDPPLPGKSSFN